jgi:predicted PurR-regulated permease PerM
MSMRLQYVLGLEVNFLNERRQIMEAILINIVVGMVCFLVGAILTYALYPKIVKQIQRTVADLKTDVTKIETKV